MFLERTTLFSWWPVSVFHIKNESLNRLSEVELNLTSIKPAIKYYQLLQTLYMFNNQFIRYDFNVYLFTLIIIWPINNMHFYLWINIQCTYMFMSLLCQRSPRCVCIKIGCFSKRLCNRAWILDFFVCMYVAQIVSIIFCALYWCFLFNHWYWCCCRVSLCFLLFSFLIFPFLFSPFCSTIFEPNLPRDIMLWVIKEIVRG